jgi:hypothetical protein
MPSGFGCSRVACAVAVFITFACVAGDANPPGQTALIQENDRYDITNMPVTLLIDRQGKIAEAHVGMVDKDAWEQEIQQLLNERKR